MAEGFTRGINGKLVRAHFLVNHQNLQNPTDFRTFQKDDILYINIENKTLKNHTLVLLGAQSFLRSTFLDAQTF